MADPPVPHRCRPRPSTRDTSRSPTAVRVTVPNIGLLKPATADPATDSPDQRTSCVNRCGGDHRAGPVGADVEHVEHGVFDRLAVVWGQILVECELSVAMEKSPLMAR